jgi:hypothetical protein
MAHLVGPSGRVYSLEILADVARTTAENVKALGIANLEIVTADAGEGYAQGAPFDRVVFTAGTYDLPSPFFEQIKDGGLLLAVIKLEGGGDALFLLRKTGDHFESMDSMPASFVPVEGRCKICALEPSELEMLPEWAELQKKEVLRTPFWWGGKGQAAGGSRWRTTGIRSFLSIAEPSFRVFKRAKAEGRARDEHYFGLWNEDNGSLVLVKDDLLIAYGNTTAQECLLRRVHEWVNLGMPTAASFALQVYPSGYLLVPRESQWVVQRNESQFLWSLERQAH